jgi:hypothetical protein
MENLNIYNAVRSVPNEAQKKITGGRLNGKTDINPMWRIKALTELFGPVGFGWYYEITEKRLESGPTGEIAAFVQINLFVKMTDEAGTDEWSKPITGLGGSMFVANESKGPFVSDECFKMALTDAISVSCKALGVGADVYWDADKTKYSAPVQQPKSKPDFKPAWLNDDEKMKGLFSWIFKSDLPASDRIRSAYLISNETLAIVIERYEKFMSDGQSANHNG